MSKKLSIIFLTLMALLPARMIAGNDFFSKLTVTTKSAAGLVYVTNDSNMNPADTEYVGQNQTMEATNTSQHAGSTTDHTYYIKAKVVAGMEDTYMFYGWTEKNSNFIITTEPVHTYTLGVSSNDETKPTTKNLEAKFIKIPALQLQSDGKNTVSISKLENEIGDVVTVTAKKLRMPDTNGGNNQVTLAYEFDHWEDGDGNILSYEPEYTFTIEKKGIIKSVGRDILGKPVSGGYYRVRNYINRVLKIEGNVEVNSSNNRDPQGGRGYCATRYQLRWALPTGHDFTENITWMDNGHCYSTDDETPLEVETDPGTVMYLTGTESGNKITKARVSSQGVDTKTLTKYEFTIEPSDTPGYYYFSQSSAAPKMRLALFDAEKVDATHKVGLSCDVYVGSASANDVTCAMALQPLDEEHMDRYWFGAKPDEAMKMDGGYWTTMYTTFPYECRDNVEAYYVKTSVAPTTENGQTILTLTKIADGKVPANTPVLLKCQGLTSKENRLLPLDPATNTINPITDNALVGELQLYTDINGGGRKNFDESTMRVLGVSNGMVGFYKLKPGANGPAELLPNKAYLHLPSLPATASASYIIRIDDGGNAGIEAIETDSMVKYEHQAIYGLDGRRVLSPRAGQVYIVNGQKILWK